MLVNLTPGTADTGSVTWIPATSGIDFGTAGLRIQISLIGNPGVLDRSTESFAVPENTNTFYVNDPATTGDEYTTAAGSNRNTGKFASAPKPYPNTILRTYPLGPTQTQFVDTGDSGSAMTEPSRSPGRPVRATRPCCASPSRPPTPRSSS